MHEDLIDDDLEEYRGYERKQLEEEGGEKDLAQETAILMDRTQEPGDIEPAGQIGKATALRHQHEPAIPYGFEFGPAQQGRSRRIRRLDNDFVLACFADQQI